VLSKLIATIETELTPTRLSMPIFPTPMWFGLIRFQQMLWYWWMQPVCERTMGD